MCDCTRKPCSDEPNGECKLRNPVSLCEKCDSFWYCSFKNDVREECSLFKKFKPSVWDCKARQCTSLIVFYKNNKSSMRCEFGNKVPGQIKECPKLKESE